MQLLLPQSIGGGVCVSGSIASILCKAPWLQHTHTSPPPQPAPIPGILVPHMEKTFSLISFNTSKILMTFGTSSILCLVFTWLQEVQSVGFWLFWHQPAASGDVDRAAHLGKLSLLSYSHHCFIIYLISRRLAVNLSQETDRVVWMSRLWLCNAFSSVPS